MRIFIFFLILFLPFSSVCNSSDSAIQKTKKWYASAAITRTYLWPPLINWRGANGIIYVVHPATVFAGYQLTPKFRAQAGLSFLNVDFDKPDDYFNESKFISEDKGQFLNIDLLVKGYILNPTKRFQPYVSLGTIVRNYWLQQNHIYYERNINNETGRLKESYNGTLLYWTINPGLQIRIRENLEFFTEYNFRATIGDISHTKIWRNDIDHFPGFSVGLTYFFRN